jgi:hypothetical protein
MFQTTQKTAIALEFNVKIWRARPFCRARPWKGQELEMARLWNGKT